MAKTKDLLEIPSILTPDVIKAIAENADALQAIQQLLSSGDEAMALKGKQNNIGCHNGCGEDDDCCCPKLIKFKIIGCTVIIINKNAACEEEDDD